MATSTSKKGEDPKQKKQKMEFTNYQSFRLHTPIKGDKVTGSFRLMGQAFAIVGKNWKLFAGIIFWYALLTIILVQGFQTVNNVNEAKDGFEGVFDNGWSEFAGNASLFVYLMGSSGESASGTTATYQALLGLIFSLAIIWTLRQLYAKEFVRIRDGFYMGIAPLVQFVLVLMVVALQLIPMVIGVTLYGSVVSGGVAASGAEHALWAVIFFISALLSLYMITSSLFALYIVTLPGMTPLRALQSARQLVRYRRWTVLRKIVFLPVAFVVMAGVLVLPLLIFATPVAAWMLFAISLILLPLAHSYMYALYRALL